MVDFNKLLNKNLPAHPTANVEQQAAIDDFSSGKHIILTGPAGTGKSFTVDRIKERYRNGISITASTGIAALNVGGCTLHSWAGLGMGTDSALSIANRITGNKGVVYDKIISAKRLAIDEVSMLSAGLLTKTDHVFRRVRKCDEPFGGIQMLLIGDFLQLPPIINNENETLRFAFESPSWEEAGITTHELQTIVRQKDDHFARVLNKIRRGLIDEEVETTLRGRLHVEDKNPGIVPVQLNGYNRQVDAINAMELAKLPGREFTFKSADTGIPAFIEQLRKHCIAPELLTVKIGAQVMLLRNLDTEGGLVNGSLGIVRDVHTRTNTPLVEFANKRLEQMDPAKWELKSDNQVLAQRSQIPLRLAWAWTIHKSQGQTMDKVEVDLNSVFEYGQAYVALSRCRNLEGLFLTGLKLSEIKADPEALAFYGYENATTL